MWQKLRICRVERINKMDRRNWIGQKREKTVFFFGSLEHRKTAIEHWTLEKQFCCCRLLFAHTSDSIRNNTKVSTQAAYPIHLTHCFVKFFSRSVLCLYAKIVGLRVSCTVRINRLVTIFFKMPSRIIHPTLCAFCRWIWRVSHSQVVNGSVFWLLLVRLSRAQTFFLCFSYVLGLSFSSLYTSLNFVVNATCTTMSRTVNKQISVLFTCYNSPSAFKWRIGHRNKPKKNFLVRKINK